MTRIKTNKIAPKIRVRIMRSWRGYSVGSIISPPGAMRQILLQAKDQLGHKIAEVVENEPEVDVADTAESVDVAAEESISAKEGGKPKSGNKSKGESK